MICKLFHSGIIALLFFVGPLQAQDEKEAVTFELKLSKEKLGVNEKLRVDFTMNQDGDNFIPPDFNGFRVIMGPTQAVSSTFANRKRYYSKTYSYILAPESKGTFTIGQGTIVIAGNTYKTIPKKVVVTEAVDTPNAPPTATDIADENLHLIAEVSDTNPYLNQPISVVYKLYFRNSLVVTNFDFLDNPKYNNFWNQEIPFSKYRIENGMFQGQPAYFIVIKRMVLYPQKSGELEIEPMVLKVNLEVPTERRNFFGERLYASTEKTVSAGKRVIQAKPLPEEGKPEDFTGAVGDFDFSVETSRRILNASESLQATVKVKGSGNLKLFELPKLNLPSALEVYEPEFEEEVRTTLSGMRGEVSENYTIVPSYRGKYPIPEISFSYFNPKTKTYERLSSRALTIEVAEGPAATPTPGAPPVTSTRTPVVSTDQFHFIKLRPNLTPKAWTPFFGTSTHWISWLGPLALIPLFLLVRKRREKSMQDVEGNKVRRANRLARKYLSAARKTLGDKDAFYVALEKALHNYLKARLKIETSEFSKDKIRELLSSRGAEDSVIGEFLGLLENCEMARYSPFSRVQMEQDYETASQVINALDKSL